MTTTQTTSPKLNDILVSSWGYDQTNIDFYKVIKVNGSFITLQPLDNKIVERLNEMAEKVVPSQHNHPYKKIIRKKFKPSNYKGYCVKIESYEFAYPYDGQPTEQNHYH
jgi:hypothetical protein